MGEQAVGNTVGADSSGEGHGVTDPSASAEFGETNEFAEYDNLTDTFPGDEREETCLLYTSPSPRDLSPSRMPSSA